MPSRVTEREALIHSGTPSSNPTETDLEEDEDILDFAAKRGNKDWREDVKTDSPATSQDQARISTKKKEKKLCVCVCINAWKGQSMLKTKVKKKEKSSSGNKKKKKKKE